MKNFKKYFAEMLGTAVLVLIACGTVIFSVNAGADTGTTIIIAGLAFGLTLAAMAYAIGHISGAHVNPAVSLGALICGRLSFKDFCFYVIAQVIGAIIGGALILLMLKLQFGFDSAINTAGAATGYGVGINELHQILQGLLVEAVLTFVFVFVILSITRNSDYNRISGLIIGLALTIVIIAGATLTGPSVNPARSIGINIFAGTAMLEQVWVSIVGPLVGAALAALAARCLLKDAGNKPSDVKSVNTASEAPAAQTSVQKETARPAAKVSENKNLKKR